MYVDVQNDLTITLEDRDNFGALSVMYALGAQGRVDQALRSGGAGYLARVDQAALAPDWLRRQGPEGPWREDCAAMLSKAKSAGWVQADGSVLAHLVPHRAPAP